MQSTMFHVLIDYMSFIFAGNPYFCNSYEEKAHI
jgi:hypothetical protein